MKWFNPVEIVPRQNPSRVLAHGTVRLPYLP
jgi:hypothetical protein